MTHGGPFQHRIVGGVCRVCGWTFAPVDPAPGCPYAVNMETYKSGEALVSAAAAERAARELHALLAKPEGTD